MKRVTITYVFAFLSIFFFANKLNAQSCAAPTNLVATNASAINANLTWDAVVGAYYYKIKINPVGSPNLIKNYTSASNSLLAAALQPVQAYECRIATVCASGVGAYSNPITFTTTTSSSCGVAQGISSFGVTSSNVSIKWTTMTGAQSYIVKIFQNGTLKKAYPITKAPIVITGLQSSTAYTYTVCSVCSNIPGADSAPGTFTTLSATSCGVPTGVTASNITNLGAKIKWNEVPGANSYKVTVTAVAIPIPITHTNIAGTSFDLIGLLPNSAYTYKVSAVCSGVEGNASALGTFTTAGLPCLQPSFVNVSAITATTANVGFIKGATGNNAMTRLFLKEMGQTSLKTFSSASQPNYSNVHRRKLYT